MLLSLLLLLTNDATAGARQNGGRISGSAINGTIEKNCDLNPDCWKLVEMSEHDIGGGSTDPLIIEAGEYTLLLDADTDVTVLIRIDSFEASYDDEGGITSATLYVTTVLSDVEALAEQAYTEVDIDGDETTDLAWISEDGVLNFVFDINDLEEPLSSGEPEMFLEGADADAGLIAEIGEDADTLYVELEEGSAYGLSIVDADRTTLTDEDIVSYDGFVE